MKTADPIIIHYDEPVARFLPFSLPPQKRGIWQIETEIMPKGKELPVVSHRNAIFMGLRPAKMKLSQPVEIHELRVNGKKHNGIMMSTRPQELEQHYRQLKRAHGHVLVGGLGLGLAAAILARNKKVTDITVIEKSKAVIDMVDPFLPRMHNNHPVIVLHRDLFKFLREARWPAHCKMHYDFAFYDIWAPTGQTVFTDYTMPLRQLSRGIVRQDQIECWNEDEIVGQIKFGIYARLTSPEFLIPLLTMPENKFKKMRKSNAEVAPFIEWLRINRNIKPCGKKAFAAAKRYCASLKNAEAFAEWERK